MNGLNSNTATHGKLLVFKMSWSKCLHSLTFCQLQTSYSRQLRTEDRSLQALLSSAYSELTKTRGISNNRLVQ